MTKMVIGARVQRIVQIVFAAALMTTSGLLLAGALLSTTMAEKAYADSYADTHQTAPTPDHVVMPKELVGKWSPDADSDQPHYIEIRYDNGDLVYYYYRMTYNLVGKGNLKDRQEEFEYNHGYVALQGNHGTCDCYVTNGSRAYVSFYVSDASKGVIYMQDNGQTWHKVGKPGKWRKSLNWPTKPDCYEETTVATVKGKTCLGPGAGGAVESAAVRVSNLRATNVGSTNALLSATAYKKPGVNVKNCGIYLGTSKVTMQRCNVEAVPQSSNDYHGGKDFDIWYDLNDELGIKLASCTKYYYRFYCEVGDEVYLSDIATFITE